jgi:hypothetical protein
MRESMMRMTKTGWVLGSGRWRAVGVGAAVLAAVGVVGAVPTPVASASPQQALGWTQQSPPVHPHARYVESMAYDAANSTVVLFGGEYGTSRLGDTWTWNGTTWTKQHPATSPPAVYLASMAYDAATGTVVLFSGASGLKPYTWTWDGTTWTGQHPAAIPPDRFMAYMAYDAATGTVVLFGGYNGCLLGDTWTWDGTTWTKQSPAVSPGARAQGAMAYDAATGTAVLFGGYASSTTRCNLTNTGVLGQTWTWG